MLIDSNDIPILNVKLDQDVIYLIGDIHVDAETFKNEKFEKANKIMGNSPKILLGDIADYAFFNDLLSQERKGQNSKEELEVQTMLLIDKIFDSLTNVIAVCEGNHDIRPAKLTGQNFLYYACKKRNIHYVRGQAVLKIECGKKQNGKKRIFRILITHGTGSSSTESGALLKLVRYARNTSGIDIVACGHFHKFIHSEVTKTVAYFNSLKTEITDVITVPSFLGHEIYAQKNGFPPPSHSIVKITFVPSDGSINIENIRL